jgi:hypothetical protein
MPGQNRHVKLTDFEKHLVTTIPNILESYHYVGTQKAVDVMRENGAKIFLDSGAFSAFTLGVELKIEDYVDYIKRNIDIIRFEDGTPMFSVLDGIGDAKLTWDNQMNMEAMGCRPLPCFHMGEPNEYLEHYIKNYDYITLGGMVGASGKQLEIWLDRVWNKYLIDGAGKAKIKVHGFGITSIPIMSNFPWYSCDSSSWIQTAAFGGIVHPTFGPLSVSSKSPARHEMGYHLCNLTPIEQDVIFSDLQKQGFDYERLATIYESRAAYNLWSYNQIGIQMANLPREKTITKQELF